jgi:hypothetical protein
VLAQLKDFVMTEKFKLSFFTKAKAVVTAVGDMLVEK